MKGRRFIVIIFTLFLFFPVLPVITDQAQAGKPVFQASIMVLENEFLLNMQKPMDMGVDPDGRIHILYQTYQSFDWDVFIVHSDDGGLTWSDPVRVDDVLEDGNATIYMTRQVNPRMTIGLDGNIYVVWEDWRNWLDDLSTRPIDIRFSRATDGGETFSTSTVITPPKSIKSWDAYKPDIDVNEDGRLFCVWIDELDAGAYKNVWSSVSTDSGSAWTSPQILNTDGKSLRNHFYPRCVMFQDHVYVTWHDERNITMGTKPFIAISHNGGDSFQDEFPLTTDSQMGASRKYAYPVVDEVGNLFISWNDERTERDEIFFTRSEDNGATFSQDKRIFVLPDETGDMDPHIAARGDGNIAIVWEREVPFHSRTETEIYFLNSSDGGRTWEKMLRIDDTDRRSPDGSNQKGVLVTFNNNGRALCTWMDSRLYVIPGPQTFDIFFTRHSRSLNNINHLPELILPYFHGEYVFDTRVGNTSTEYTFKLEYKDEDNDEPELGFPRVQVYRDPKGNDPVFAQFTAMTRENGTSDIYFMDGVWYTANFTIPEQGIFYWKVEINDGVDTAVISSDIFPGPIIDTTLPTLDITSPIEVEWLSTEVVECRVIIRDTGGSGVSNSSIMFVKSVSGLGYFESPFPVKGVNRIDNDTYEAWANVRLDPGTQNYVKFQAHDRVGNGPAESEPVNIWVDADAPYAVRPTPLSTEIKIYDLVNCTITFRDSNPGSTAVNHTGLDPGSIRYSFRTTSDDFSDWLEPVGYMLVENRSYLTWTQIEFPDEGVYNFIRWKALDLIGNEFITQGYRITVDVPDNYIPVFNGEGYPKVISTPTPHIWWDPAFDEENDPLYYRVKLLKYPTELQLTGWLDLGQRTYFDVPDIESMVPNHYILRINVTDRIGGYDLYDHVIQIIDTGTPPPEDIPPLEPFYSNNGSVMIDWEPSPSDTGTGIEYWIRIGSAPYQGDVLEWMVLDGETEFQTGEILSGIGIYSIQIIAHSDGNFSRVTQGLVKISDYTLDGIHPAVHTAYKGKGITITRPVICSVVNNGTFDDNVTIVLSGELVDKGWAYLNDTGTPTGTYLVPTSKMLSDVILEDFRITVSAPDTARTGKYTIGYRLISEDGSVEFTGEIVIDLKRAPDEDEGETFADDLSGLITDVLPFLEGAPTGVVLAIFLLLLLLVVGGMILLGILLVKRAEKKKKDDPDAEKKRIYKEIYGREPTEEELRSMNQADESPIEAELGIPDDDGPSEPSLDDVDHITSEETGKDLDLPVEIDTDENISTGDGETDDLLEKLFD